MSNADKKKSGWKHEVFHEMIEYWLNVLYLTIFF